LARPNKSTTEILAWLVIQPNRSGSFSVQVPYLGRLLPNQMRKGNNSKTLIRKNATQNLTVVVQHGRTVMDAIVIFFEVTA
jgi:hypothetical protein